MKTRIYSILTGLFITLLVSGFSFYYLSHIKGKKAFQTQNPYLDVVETMDHRFNDLKFKFSAKATPNSNVVLIAVDDASLKEIGRWPWSRDITSELIEKLMSYGVKAVGMDIIFSEPEKANPENDARLGRVVEKHGSQIVLGAFSEQRMKIQPYQDYCVNEAFLTTGGDSLVKINPTFVVDDTEDPLEVLAWDTLFRPIFKAVRRETESQYLHEMSKKSVEELSAFQTKYLASKKNEDLFNYCERWLTDKDSILFIHKPQLEKLYNEVFSRIKDFQGLTFDGQVEKFKKIASTELPTPQYGEWQGNIQPIQEPSSYTGSFVVQTDLDGYVRRYPLFFRSGNRLGTSYIPSLAIQTYLAATGYRADVTIEKVKDKKVITSFKIMDAVTDPDKEKMVQEIPVDAHGQMIVNYYGSQNTLPYVSAKDFFSDDETVDVNTAVSNTEFGQVVTLRDPVKKKDFFAGKTVIIGPTAVAIYDLRSTPTAANYPGPEIHLTVLANLFSKQFINRLKNEVYLVPLGLLVLGLFLSICLSLLGPAKSVLTVTFTFVICLAWDQFIFQNYHVLFSSVFFMLEIPFVFLAIIVFKYSTEERKKNELRRMFSKYVSPAVVDELLKSEENLKLGGRKQEMSVFFSDVRGFTEFSEKMDPQDLSQFLNEYLTPMTEMVFNNKGTLDKYMGDGLMAFFGAPVPFADHAFYACRCALQSIEHLKLLQVEFAKRNWPKIEIGIGVNTGFMSVGNMGSKIVQSYTVIGDAVNLGSRLEAANKEYGTRILISESTYKAVVGKFIVREVDLVRVKGKKEPIKAYELIAESADQAVLDWLKTYDVAYTSYHKQHFEVAKHQFAKIELEYPNDAVSRMYRKRCEEFILEPPVSDWDGVYIMKTK